MNSNFPLRIFKIEFKTYQCIIVTIVWNSAAFALHDFLFDLNHFFWGQLNNPVIFGLAQPRRDLLFVQHLLVEQTTLDYRIHKSCNFHSNLAVYTWNDGSIDDSNNCIKVIVVLRQAACHFHHTGFQVDLKNLILMSLDAKKNLCKLEMSHCIGFANQVGFRLCIWRRFWNRRRLGVLFPWWWLLREGTFDIQVESWQMAWKSNHFVGSDVWSFDKTDQMKFDWTKKWREIDCENSSLSEPSEQETDAERTAAWYAWCAQLQGPPHIWSWSLSQTIEILNSKVLFFLI